MSLDSGKCFEFWRVFMDGFWEVFFWTLGGVLDYGGCFGFREVLYPYCLQCNFIP